MKLECVSSNVAPGFICTGSDESHIWAELHDIQKSSLLPKFHCGTCQTHFFNDMKGYHGHISLGLGKKLLDQYKKDYNNFVNSINEVNRVAKNDGRV